MTDDVCRREADVRKGSWSDELRAHAESCPDCAAAAAVSPWMASFAAMPDREHPLPDPSVVWLKARLLRATVAAERAARPMTVAQMSAYVGVAACWAALLMWKWTSIEAWMAGLSPTHIVRGDFSPQSLSLSFFALVFMLSSATVVLALHTILAED